MTIRLTVGPRAVLGLGVIGVTTFLLLGAPTAQAHPLGNFSVNHSHSLRVTGDRVVDHAVIDFAEIPTTQASRTVDTDGDGDMSAAELQAFGRATCAAVRDGTTLSVDASAVALTITSTSYVYQPGQAGLPTSRLECDLEAVVDLSVARTVSFVDVFEPDRVGWHEIIAVGDGVALINSPVPQVSTTDTLRTYPTDLLDSPLDVRQIELSVSPTTGDARIAAPASAPPSAGTSMASGGPFADVVDRITREFNGLVGRHDLTLGVGLLAVSLAMILGASHALLPGHGKTVMAAYIAGRQGSSRDAVIVGATVTATHTGGVLLLGLALTLSTALAGEVVLAWLGVASGSLIAALGISLLLGAVRHRPMAHGHRHGGQGSHIHGSDGHSHSHGHGHGHDHPHPHPDLAEIEVPRRLELVVPNSQRMQLSAVALIDRPAPESLLHTLPPIDPPVVPQRPPVSRRGLIGMGIAGGLVPSPSALIVLLSAIALGRTAFGVLLVVGYGLGMAATLTLAGLLLVRVRDRYQRRHTGGQGRVERLARRWTKIIPYSTAALVMLVGVGLAVRSIGSV